MSADGLRVVRRILIPLDPGIEASVDKRHVGLCIWPVNTTYVSRSGNALLQQYSVEVASDTFGKIFERRSSDNGRTWSEATMIFQPTQTEQGVFRTGESCLFFDPGRERVVRFYNEHLYPKSHYSGEVIRFTRIRMRVSDRGQPFGDAVQVIQKGCDEKNWARGVTYGENSMQISFCAPALLSNGKVLLPAMMVPKGADLSNPFLLQEQSCCFIGEWKGDRMEWELGDMVRIDPAVSTRGLCEPAVAELVTGEVLMVCRGSNSTAPHLPGYHWYAVSGDLGRTWSQTAPMRYDTGESFFSPATGSRLIRHSRNGKLYWIGNIAPRNPDGNRPRYPLQLAEVDEEKKAIRKDTVGIIEDRQPGDSPHVQFSNFRVYEDRETGEFVLTLARIQMVSEKDLSSPAYEYRFSVK